jgi:solute carrier family 26 (sodium-independent sulfate anion transporter), member 11
VKSSSAAVVWIFSSKEIALDTAQPIHMMLGQTNLLGRGLANILGIKLEDQKQDLQAEVASSSSIFSEQRNSSFYETEPTSSEWLKEQTPSKEEVVAYAASLFPFATWISHYNLQWFAGDLVAGITIGAVVVPQGMAYAILANLEPQFGLYSSFIGALIYWIFGTSKDISIGPVAVLSTVVGNVVQDVQDSGQNVPAHVVASALSVIAGFIVLIIGLLRCGWIVDLISITSLSAFMTGSAITICVGQLPALLGLSGFSNRDPPYKVLANTIEHLGEAGYDAIVGASALSILYLIRQGFTAAAERYPKHKRLLFFTNTMRTVFVILVYTVMSWVLNMHRRDDPLFKVLGVIPKGTPITIYLLESRS